MLALVWCSGSCLPTCSVISCPFVVRHGSATWVDQSANNALLVPTIFSFVFAVPGMVMLMVGIAMRQKND